MLQSRASLVALVGVSFFSIVSAQAPPPAAGCDPAGGLRFVCGQSGPEDLVAVPRTPWLVASAYADDGGINLIDTAKGTSARIFPTASATERFDRNVYGACPGPLAGADRAMFQTHGLAIKAGRRSVHTLYAVHHGGRESVEVFELNAGATPPSMTWIGCVIAPEPIGLNALVPLPDGGFAATNFDPRPAPGTPATGLSAKLMSGERNGEVWEWHTKAGWIKVPGSESAGANGLEISSDGKWYYVAQWGNKAFMRLSRGRTPVERQEIPLGFRVDNVRWAPDGKTLLVAGQLAATTELPQQGPGANVQTSVIGRVDPQAMTYQELIKRTLAPGVTATTVAVQVGNEFWTGSFRGDRVTRYPVPAAK